MSQDPGYQQPPQDPENQRNQANLPQGQPQPDFQRPGGYQPAGYQPTGQQQPAGYRPPWNNPPAAPGQPSFNPDYYNSSSSGPSSSGPGVMLIAGIVFGILALMLVGIGTLVFLAASVKPPGVVQNNPLTESGAVQDIDSDPEPDKFRKSFEAFSGEPLGYHDDLESITGFLFELAEVADQSGSKEFKTLFSADNYVREMRDSGFITGLARLTSNRDLIDITISRVLGPVSFSEFTIYRIDEVAGYPTERIVYVVTSDDDFYSMPQRFWLKPDGGSWLIYDWEPLDYGIRDSYETAVLIGCPDSQSDAYSDYVDTSNSFDEAIADLSGSFDFALNESRLRRIERLNYPPYLRNELLLDIAHRWEELGDLEGKTHCLKSAVNPDRTPGILIELAASEMDYGNYEEALKYFQRYENAVGPMLKSREQTATCFQLLHDTRNEVKTRLDIIERFPESPAGDHISRIIVNGTDSEVRKALEFADNCFDPESLYYELISNFENSFGIDTYIRKVSEHLDNTAPGLDHTRNAKLAMYETRGKLDDALEVLMSPLNEDPENSIAAYELLYFAADNDLMDRVDGVVDPYVAFSQLDQLYDEGYVDSGALNDFAMKLLEEEPDDPTANYYAGLSFSGREMFEEAIPYLERSAEDFEEDGVDESGVSEYASRVLSRCRYMTMDPVEVVEIYQDDEDRLDFLTYYMLLRNDYEAIEAVLDISEVDFENRLLCDAALAHSMGEFDIAAEYLRELVDSESFDPEDYSQSTFHVRRLLTSIAESGGDITQAARLMPTDFMIAGLQAELAARNDDAGLKKLGEVVKSLGDKSITVTRDIIEVTRLFDSGDYTGVLQYAAENQLEHMPLDNFYDLSSTPYPMVVRSAIRSGQLSEQRRLVDRLASRGDSELGDNSLLLLLSVLREDRNNYKRLIANSYETTPFLGDLDVAPELLAEARHEHHTLYPSSLPVFSSGDEYRLQILLSGDPEYEAASIQAKLESAGFKVDTVSALSEQATNTASWIVNCSEFTVALSVRPRHPVDPSALSRAANDDQRATNDHTHQLHIDVVYYPYHGEIAEATAFEIAYALENENYMAIYDNVDSMAWRRVKAVFDDRRAKFGPETRTTWIHLENYSAVGIPTEDFDYERARTFVAGLMPLLDEYSAAPDSAELTVGVVCWRSEAREIVPVRVTGIHTNMYGLPVFSGEVIEASQLYPAVVKGLPVEATIWNIRSYELTTDGSSKSDSYIGNDS